MTETYEQYNIYGINLSGPKEQRAICPECQKRKGGFIKDTDLAVNIEEGIWKCWSGNCKWTGSLKKERKPFERPSYNPIKVTSKPLTDTYYSWFKSRGIPQEVVDRNLITKDKVFIQGINKEEFVTCFNYYVGEDLVNIKYRTHDKHFSQVKDADKIFYKLNDIENEPEVIITEGEIDALSFEVAGYKNAVSVPDGAVQPNAKNLILKMSYLDNCSEYFENKVKIYLATDTDAPGLRLREELARRLGKGRCWIVTYPEDCKDANEVLTKHSKTVLMNCVLSAEPYPVEGIYYAKQFETELSYLHEHGYPDGAKTGWVEFDRHLTIYGSTFMVVTGFPSHGKTSWLNEFMIRLSLRYDWKWGVFSTEYGKIEILLQVLCEILIGKPLLKCYNGYMSKAEMNQALEWLNEHFFIIEPENENYKMANIKESVKYLVLKHGIKGVISDPWNCILHNFNGDTETIYTEKTLNDIIYFEREYDLLYIQVVHPAKPSITKGGTAQKPNLYSISGSANWFNKAEIGITIWREFDKELENTKYTEVIINKAKHKYIGRTGSIRNDFDVKSQRFYEQGHERYEGSFLEKLGQNLEIVDFPEPVHYYNEPKEDDDVKF